LTQLLYTGLLIYIWLPWVPKINNDYQRLRIMYNLWWYMRKLIKILIIITYYYYNNSAIEKIINEKCIAHAKREICIVSFWKPDQMDAFHYNNYKIMCVQLCRLIDDGVQNKNTNIKGPLSMCWSWRRTLEILCSIQFSSYPVRVD